MSSPVENLNDEQKDKQVKFTPAPIPTNSPWKCIPNEILNSNNSKWPSAHEAVKKLEESKKGSSGISNLNGRVKWVPMKASITLSDNGSCNEIQNPKKSKNKKTKKKATHKQNNRRESRQDGDDNSIRNQNTKSNQEKKILQQNHVSRKITEFNPNLFHQRKKSLSNHTQPSKNLSQKVQYNLRTYHNNGYQYRPKIYQTQPFYHPIMSVQNIARQIEYYFSEENLAKDKYLTSQFNSNGYVKLSVIAKFYRIVNMSFGGDINLIMGALNEIITNEMSTFDVGLLSDPIDENPLNLYAIRTKQWESWLPEEPNNFSVNENILDKNALVQFKVDPPILHSKQSYEQNQINFITNTEN